MQILRTVEDCQNFRQQCADEVLALVPTMGALHDGHLSLVRLAKEKAQKVIVSIFVNPLQFGQNEDFNQYPRPLEEDLEKCKAAGVDAVFAPSVDVMYPEDDATHVVPPEALTERLCGLARPGHFTGVATVVLKLFQIVLPDVAVFGEKDGQQLVVIQNMVNDLNLPVQIIPHPTVREEDGLALSSRNRYFKTDEERRTALVLSATLRQLQQRLKASSGQAVQPLLKQTLDEVLQQKKINGLFKLEYLEAVDPKTLAPVESLNRASAKAKLMMAAHVGSVRLIDNMDVEL